MGNCGGGCEACRIVKGGFPLLLGRWWWRGGRGGLVLVAVRGCIESHFALIFTLLCRALIVAASVIFQHALPSPPPVHPAAPVGSPVRAPPCGWPRSLFFPFSPFFLLFSFLLPLLFFFPSLLFFARKISCPPTPRSSWPGNLNLGLMFELFLAHSPALYRAPCAMICTARILFFLLFSFFFPSFSFFFPRALMRLKPGFVISCPI